MSPGRAFVSPFSRICGEKDSMRGTTFRAVVVAFPAMVVLFAGTAVAQERPADDEIFGGTGQGEKSAPATTPATATTTTTTTTTATTTTDTNARAGAVGGTGTQTGTPVDSRDTLNLGNPEATPRLSASVAPEDPLRMGGQFYWRAMSTGRQGQWPQNWSLSAPALLDVYMDARPNDRVRAFVLGRMSYDPTLPPNGTTSATSGASGQFGPGE